MWPKYLGMLAKLDTARVGRGDGTWINKCCLMCRDPSELESQQFLSQFFDLTVFCRRYDPEDNTAGGAAGEKKSDGGGREGGWEKEVTFLSAIKRDGRWAGPPRYFLYVAKSHSVQHIRCRPLEEKILQLINPHSRLRRSWSGQTVLAEGCEEEQEWQ